ncbi:hypothetical protein HGRIS_001889 [Hohenbuehelia grisea]|uniref:Transmembrane protein n=1 Tax=Hohenbuehelia grisea TaxID=104357 RepID=A0ABR3JJS8_9AGAR
MRTPALTALPRLWLSPFVLLCLTRLSLASLVNVTVDDVFGDPESGSHIVYSSEAWNDGRNCSGCAAKPESSKVFQGKLRSAILSRPATEFSFTGTWTDSSFDGSRETVLQNATLGFSGTAVYVFCVVDILGSTDISFYIDGAAVGSFVQKAGESSQRYQYNTSVYANSSLPDGPHTLTIQNGRIGGGVVSILLDYVVYSHSAGDSSSPTPGSTGSGPSNDSSNTNRSKIIIGVCSAVGGLLIIVASWLSCYFLRRRRKQRQEEAEELRPQAFSDFVVARSPPSEVGTLRSPRSMKTLEATGLSSLPSSSFPLESASTPPSSASPAPSPRVPHSAVSEDTSRSLATDPYVDPPPSYS